MKSKELILNNEVELDSTLPRIGGHSFLPEQIDWPVNPDGIKLTLIASIPVKFVKEQVAIENSDSGFISVFSTYDPEDYFLDLVTYHGDEEEYENITNGYTKVIVHEKGTSRNDAEKEIPAREMKISGEVDNESEHSGSRIGGTAGLLQKNELNLGNAQFLCQFYGGDFPEEFTDIFDLADAVGYIYIDPKNEDNKFFVQAT